MGNFQCLIKHILEEWGRRRGLTYQEVLQLTSNEILKDKFNKKELQKRLEGYIYFLENDKQHIITGKAKKQFLKKEGVGTEKKTEVIKGLSVFPGKVSGKVRKGTAYTFDQIQKGDILVCPKTDPSWVPILGKVSGIITEGGGLLSHAAIVSRELKIPCIVGVAEVFNKLKDDYLIEMNGKTGEITILEKTKQRAKAKSHK